jgi:photosystem II stability/assembly factor-like uncharacterized protein
MSSVRLLVGTKKGAFILTSDGTRKQWDVSSPHFGGWEMYHLKGSPVEPNRIYASQTSSWFGQVIQRSDDGGKTWNPPGTKPEDLMGPDGMPKGESNMFLYDASAETGQPLTTHQHYDGSQRPWEFKRVWHLEPSLTDPDTVYAGAEDAALFKSMDGGKTWKELAGLRSAKGQLWQPGAGGMCLHTIVQDPTNPRRIYIAISAAGTFRSDDGGMTWRAINRGLKSKYELPDSDAEVGHCVHRIAMHPTRPNVLFMQKHWDVMRSDDAGESWHGGNEWEALTNGLPQRDCYVNVLRDAMAVDSLDPCGIYFGTSGGQVYASADAGDSWTPIVRDLPAVLSVEVQTLP